MSKTAILRHVAISVPDVEQTVAWYRDCFGLEEISRMHIPHNGLEMVFIGNDDFVIELIQAPGANPLPEGRSHPDIDNFTHGVKHICIAVDNCKAFIEELKKKGVRVVFEFQPAGDISCAAFINDNAGNIIEVFDVQNDSWKNGGQ